MKLTHLCTILPILLLLTLLTPTYAEVGNRFYSPNEELYCEVGTNFSWLNGATAGIELCRKNQQTIYTQVTNFIPQEVHLDDSGRWIILLGLREINGKVNFNQIPGIQIIDTTTTDTNLFPMHQLVTAKEIRVTGQRILWHEFEQTGFLTDAAHFQLTTRRGEKLYFNLEQASIVDYQGDAELIDMGWCH